MVADRMPSFEFYCSVVFSLAESCFGRDFIAWVRFFVDSYGRVNTLWTRECEGDFDRVLRVLFFVTRVFVSVHRSCPYFQTINHFYFRLTLSLPEYHSFAF
ncbi:hypothetical protein L596_028088 [Steinernema carpocapsae]|uniref:Uncharacterized protein n=1 Tax=Steinernema carpocapsae TaxID=34508 RepID=A0A4U5LXG7_STECR|nr:hypothetical protein L596_028088 [Steinernema carpocapsae]